MLLLLQAKPDDSLWSGGMELVASCMEGVEGPPNCCARWDLLHAHFTYLEPLHIAAHGTDGFSSPPKD